MRYEGNEFSGGSDAPVVAQPTSWVPTEEPHVYQRGEGDTAEYKVRFPDGEEQTSGVGDEAFLMAARLRDEMARNRATRGILLTEVVDVKIPPNPGDDVLIEGKLLRIDGDDGHVQVGEGEDAAIFAVEYGTLRKYDRPEA